MTLSFRPPGGNQTWNSVILVIGGGLLIWIGLHDAFKFITLFGAVFIASGIGLWFRQAWAHWSGGISLLLYAGTMILGMVVGKKFRWNALVTLVVILLVAWQVLGDRPKRKDEEDDEDEKDGAPRKPLTSFVLFLTGPRRMTAAQLAEMASRAWGGTFASEDKMTGDREEERWIVGDSPVFLARSPDAMFMIHNFPGPYTDKVKEMAQAVSDLRLRKAIEDHRSWLAVDLVQPFDSTRTPESFYSAIARLVAELAGDDTLAIYHPQSSRINAWDGSLKEALRGSDPLKDFARAVNPPVLQIDDKDPGLVAGKEEARRRFPEFVDAFRRKDGETFTVKAPITAGSNTEHIWIEVDEVGDDRISGKLGNEPVNLGGMKIGDPVDVSIAEIEDWAYVRNGEHQGLFTARTVARRKKPGA